RRLGVLSGLAEPRPHGRPGRWLDLPRGGAGAQTRSPHLGSRGAEDGEIVRPLLVARLRIRGLRPAHCAGVGPHVGIRAAPALPPWTGGHHGGRSGRPRRPRRNERTAVSKVAPGWLRSDAVLPL